MNTIGREQLQALLADGAVVLVEALPQHAFEAEHIPGAVNVAGDLTEQQAVAIARDKTSTVVTYCTGPGCQRSKVTAAAFVRYGYTDVRIYVGGKMDWAQAGLPFAGSRAQEVGGDA